MNNNILLQIQSAVKGDRSAQKEIYVNYASMVLGICKRYCVDQHQAKDYMQECFLHIFEVLHRYDSNKGSFEYWLSRVCVNKVLKLLRKQKKNKLIFPEHVIEITNDTYLEDSIEHISDEELMYCINELPIGYKTVINLYVFESYSHKEIAEQLNISVSASRSQYFKAKKLLKKLILNKLNFHYEQKLA